MKHLVVALMLVASCAWGQIIYQANSPIVEWDASTSREDGAPYPAGAVVSYEIGWSVSPVANRESPDIVLGETAGVSIAFETPGFLLYALAGRTKVVSAGVTEYSPWLWSDVDGYPGAWLVTKVPLITPPKRPERIRVN